MFHFIKKYQSIAIFRRKIGDYSRKILFIQSMWRKLMREDKRRQDILSEMWEERVKALMLQCQGKTRKNQVLLRKLKLITPEIKKEALAGYYNKFQSNFLDAYHSWYGKTKNILKVLFSIYTEFYIRSMKI